MRITFIIQDLFDQGAQYVTALLTRGFVQKNYDVDLIVSKVHSDLLATGKKCFSLPPKVNLIILRDRKARNNIAEIRKYLSATDAIAIVAMSSNYAEAVAIASLGLAHRPKMYMVEHGPTGVDRTTDELIAGPRLSCRLFYEKFIFSRFDGIFGVSQGTVDGIRRIYGVSESKLKVVYNPVIDDDFLRKSKCKTTHPWLLNKDVPTFVAVGAFTKTKNHLMLFDAVRLAIRQKPIRLIVFGRDNATENLSQKYEDFIKANGLENHISLGGYCSNIPAELKSADGFICSSHHESFSVAIVEALAAGCPVVSTNCYYGPKELLHDGRFGFLVKNNDVHEMMQAILNVADGKGIVPPCESWEPYTLPSIVARYEKCIGL